MPAFLLATFLSAFLLFGVQPLVSRYILPWFGGAPSVWSASLLFFQAVLLAGYGYAHSLAAHPRRRIPLHVLLLAGSVLFLLGTAWAWGAPLLPGPAWRPPDSGQPFLRIILLLLVGVGLPYFVLSSTSPLLQAWFSGLHPGYSPYRLYALSNLGSFLALLSYPFIFEPRLTLQDQSRLWSLAYLLYFALTLYVSLKARAALTQDQPSAISDQQSAINNFPALDPLPLAPILWLALPACTSILLLAITNHLTQEVAVVPFLWVAPLGIYLLTFALAFAGERWYPRVPLLTLLGIATLFLAYAYQETAAIGILPQFLIYAAYLFFAGLVLHGELYRLRPEPARLTSFYFLVSLGGALGGFLVNLAAPLLFDGYWELPAGVLLCCALVVILLIKGSWPIFHRRRDWLAALLIVLVIAGSSYFFIARIRTLASGVVEMQRNFYGVYRVRRVWVGDPPLETLYLNHGITSHGFQFIQPERRDIPTSYYSRTSGVGLALSTLRDGRSRPAEDSDSRLYLKVGVIGLGTGTLAAYGQEGDLFRFYEINPDIIELALGRGGHFTYLQDTRAAVEVIPGDARLSLAGELEARNPQGFDLLVVDAFSSDAIPVHLLTAEAFQLYLAHLAPDGVLAVHISNRYLDLAPLIRVQGELQGLDLAVIRASGDKAGASASHWVLLSRDPAFFSRPQISRRAAPLDARLPSLRPWTDSYTNLLPYLRTDTLFKIP